MSSFLLEKAGLEMSPYNSYLLKLYNQLPVINSISIIDKTGDYYSKWVGTPYKDVISDYESIQYNKILDKKHKLDWAFSLQES